MSEPLVKKPKETVVHEAFIFTFPPDQKKKYVDRYLGRVEKRGPDDCWEFNGNKTSNGYGYFPIFHEKIATTPAAHRLAWVIQYNMLIPKGLCVCHRCDNRICCNPSHLFLGTIKTNLKDRDLKGRCGGKWRSAKVSIIKKKNIIITKLSTNLSNIKISKLYKVKSYSVTCVYKTFFGSIKDRSWLPELLKSRYSHCKSWMEAKELKKRYDEQDREADNNKIQSTNPL